MRYVMTGTVARIVQRVAKDWRGGVGKDAMFDEVCEGWSVQLEEWPTAALDLGRERPELTEGQRVRLTLEVLP